jgi:hypothetical protein
MTAPADTAGDFGPTDPGRATPGQVPTGREFKPDYTYVVRDLRRIGLLAGSLIIVLVVLSFFLK